MQIGKLKQRLKNQDVDYEAGQQQMVMRVVLLSCICACSVCEVVDVEKIQMYEKLQMLRRFRC